MSALYNEFDPYAAQWLTNLVAAGHISPGVVDARPIQELTAADITTPQAHFFAGIGVWSHALREAGYPDDFPIWSGSCPCQPFSGAGRRAGIADVRHLWPEWLRLIRIGRPAIVVGEQVASPDGLAWLDAVHADLEGAGYAFAAFDLCAAGVGAPHIRQRLYFAAVRLGDAHGDGAGRDGRAASRAKAARGSERGSHGHQRDVADASGGARGLGDADDQGPQGPQGPPRDGLDGCEPGRLGAQPERHGAASSVWGNPDWIACRDGKLRPVEPGTFPLAHGSAGRVGRLRAYGNAIVAPLAATFLEALRPSVAHLFTEAA